MTPGKITVFCISAFVAQSVLAERAAAPQPRYRDGEPAVFTPPPPPAAPQGLSPSRLREALASARNPRFVLMWNKGLSDNVMTEYEHVASTSTVAQVTTPPPTATLHMESRTGTKAVREQGERSALNTDDDWEVRGGFENWLIGAGMNLVDRISALRQAGIKLDSDQPNLQKLEMEALKSHADYMLEVLSTPSDGPAGAKFRVRVTHLKTGRTIASFSSTGAMPTVTVARYEASDSGFQRVTDSSSTSIDEVGQQLARELGERLIPVIRGRP